eukprot:TRINITY_DN107195_c0_g1_i1.p1 TRINITY_DN107195_c0_g1~~TRINITY_DN107195_c0_g1_i1.p1  ORF type:complete len:763 (+),score=146.21 TRINITY_DN107195_c0_g1_i1:62-2350(+)
MVLTESSRACAEPGSCLPDARSHSASRASGDASGDTREPALSSALPAFNDTFDEHFEIRSAAIGPILAGSSMEDISSCFGGDCGGSPEECAKLPSFKTSPVHWGMRVRVLQRLLSYVIYDASEYASSHMMDSKRQHVCSVTPCSWHHHKGARQVERKDAHGELRPVPVDMNLMVRRYVKPWTEDFENAGLALVLNAGYLADRPGRTADQVCRTTTFISHYWGERFADFTSTIRNSGLLLDDVVWICSFAIWQHGDISGALESVTSCPFAVVVKEVPRVLLVTDQSAKALERCWVVLEAKLAQQWDKAYYISLPDDADLGLWQQVGKKLQSLDVRNCGASREEDKRAILAYAERQAGGIDAVNDRVHLLATKAIQQAELMLAAKTGSLENLQQARAFNHDELTTFSTLNGGSALHIVAQFSQVNAMHWLLSHKEHSSASSINQQCNDGHTPLHVAAKSGALASVKALVALQANVEIAAWNTGARPLHNAVLSGSCDIVKVLLQVRAETEATCTYRGAGNHTPLTIAARNGYGEVCRVLIAAKANLSARAAGIRTALHLAAIQGHAEVVTILVTSCLGAVDEPEALPTKRTPLMYAAWKGHSSVVAVLLGARADPSIRDGRGFTVKHYVMLFGEVGSWTRLREVATLLGVDDVCVQKGLGYRVENPALATLQMFRNMEKKHGATMDADTFRNVLHSIFSASSDASGELIEEFVRMLSRSRAEGFDCMDFIESLYDLPKGGRQALRWAALLLDVHAKHSTSTIFE